MPPLGFVLLTHERPAQLWRLVRALNALYGCPPIVIHHDWDRCPLDESEKPSNVLFVRPHVRTGWGGFSLVEAMLAGMRAMAGAGRRPEWVTLLSGSDYPARGAADVLGELRSVEADALVDFEEIDPRKTTREWQRGCVERYFRFYVPRPRRTPHGFRVSHEGVKNPWLLWLLSPYSRKFRCYAGSQWFTARTDAIAKMLDWNERNSWLAKHLSDRWCTDETFTQTALCNLAGVRVKHGNRRYVDWSNGDAHPKTLALEDVPKILESGAHFARKFEEGSPALDELDRVLGLGYLGPR